MRQPRWRTAAPCSGCSLPKTFADGETELTRVEIAFFHVSNPLVLGDRQHSLGDRIARRFDWMHDTLANFCARAFTTALAVSLLLATPCRSRAADPAPKRVLMLQSFGLRFKPWTDFAEFFRSELSKQSKAPIDFLDHTLLTARVDDDEALAPFVDYLLALYAKKAPDLIVALGAPAAEFVQRYRARLFPNTPMMFTAVEARRVQYDELTENDTVAAAAHDFPAAIETILQVLPDTKVIAVVNGASPNEVFWQGVLERNSRRSAGVLNCDGTISCHSKIF